MVSFKSAIAVVVSATMVHVTAQTSDVQCVYASWASNGDNQNPCEIWAALGSKCGNFSVPALPPISNGSSYTYPPPGSGPIIPSNACQCNHVAYSLMAACSWCQEGVYSDSWVSEQIWGSECSSYDSNGIGSGFDSNGLNIPPYSLQPIPGPVWDPTDAQAAQVRLGSSGTANGSTNSPGHAGGSSSTARLSPALLVVSLSLSFLL